MKLAAHDWRQLLTSFKLIKKIKEPDILAGARRMTKA